MGIINMALLDDVIAGAGSPTIADATAKVQNSLNRVTYKMQDVAPQVVGNIMDGENPQGYSRLDTQEDITRNQTIGYLDTKLAEHQKRKDETGLTSYSNLTSTNAAVWGISNGANLVKKGFGSVTNAWNGGAATLSNFQADRFDSVLPDDIKDIASREEISRNRKSSESEMQTLFKQSQNPNLTDEQVSQMYKRIEQLKYGLNNAPTPEELARLDGKSKFSSLKNTNIAEIGGVEGTGITYREILKERDHYRNNANRIQGDRKNGVASMTGSESWGNNVSLDNVRDQLQDTEKNAALFEEANRREREGEEGAWTARLQGIAGTAGDYLGRALENPGVIPDLLADSAAYLMPVVGQASILGDAAGVYSSGIQDAMQKSGASAATPEEQLRAAAIAGGYALAGQAERMTGLAAVKGGLPSLGTNQAANVIQQGVGAVSKNTVGKTPYVGGILDMATRGATAVGANTIAPATKVGAATVAEGASEGAQTYLEGLATDNVNYEDIGAGIGLGGVMGGTLATPGAIVSQGGTIASNLMQKQTAKQVEATVGKADVTIDQLLDRNDENYAPEKAINRATLEVVKADDPELLKNQADVAYERVKENLDRTNKQLTEIKKIDAMQAKYDAWVISASATVDQFIAANPDRAEQARASYANLDTTQRNELQRLKELDPKNLQEDAKRFNEDLGKAKAAHQQFMSNYNSRVKANAATDQSNPANPVTPPVVDNGLDTQVQGTDLSNVNADPVSDPNAVSQSEDPVTVSTNLLAAPSFGSVQQMQSLSQDLTLPEPIRKQLRVVSEALIAENATKRFIDVNNDVMKGTAGYRGTSEYIQMTVEASAANDTRMLNILENQISNFESNITSKINAVLEAEAAAKNSNKVIQVVRNVDGTWDALVDRRESPKVFKQNNGLDVNPSGTGKLMGAMQANLKAIQAARTAMAEITGGKGQPVEEQANASIEEELAQLSNPDQTAQAFQDEALPADGQQAPEPAQDDFTAAMESLQADNRANLDFNPARDAQAALEQQPVIDENLDETNQTTTTDNPFEALAQEGSTANQPATQPETKAPVLEPVAATTPQPEKVKAKPVKEDRYPKKDGWESQVSKAGNFDIYSKQDGQTKQVVQVDKKTGEVTKDEKRTSHKEYVTDPESGSKYSFVVYRDTKKPGVIKDVAVWVDGVKQANLGKQGSQSDEQFLADYVEANGLEIPMNFDEAMDQLTAMDEDQVYDDFVPVDIQMVQTDYSESTDDINTELAVTLENTDISAKTNEDGSIDESPKGAISILETEGKSYKESIASEREVPIREQNLVKSGFVQRLKEGSNSPLVQVKNLFSYMADNAKKHSSNATQIAQFIRATTGRGNSAAVTQSETALVDELLSFAYNNIPRIQRIVRKDKDIYRSKGFAEFFMNRNQQGEYELDENVAFAVAVGVVDWLGAQENVVSDTPQLGRKIGIDNAKVIPHEVADMLAYSGEYQNLVAKEIGTKIMQALQLKMLKDVDEARKSKVIQALGSVAIATMMDQGLVQRAQIKNDTLNGLRELVLGANDLATVNEQLKSNGVTNYVRPSLVLDQENEPVIVKGNVQHIKSNYKLMKLSKEAPGLLSKIFGFTPESEQVSLVPIETTPAQFNDLGSSVSDFQKDVIKKQQATPYGLNNAVIDGLAKFRDKAPNQLAKVLGWKDPSLSLKIREKAIVSKNDQISRSMNFLFSTAEVAKDKPFYLPLSVWSNMRSGITSAFNPQADKIHRGASYLLSDEITVPSRQKPYKDGKLTKYGMYLRALGFRLEDVKIPEAKDNIDKVLDVDYIPHLDVYIKSPEVKSAAEAYTRILNDTATQEDFAKVADLIAEWDNHTLGLSALSSIADFHAARSTGKSFKAVIFAESDGSNNGPAITHAMMNTGTTEMLESVGMFKFVPQGQRQLTNLAQYRAFGGVDGKGGKDLYQQLARTQKDYLQLMLQDLDMNSPEGKAFAALNSLDDALGTRSGAKRILVPFNYGSGMDAVHRANARGTYDTILDKLELAIQEGDSQRTEDIIEQINTILEFYNTDAERKVALLDPTHFLDLNLDMPNEVRNAITAVNTKIRGEITEAALKDTLGDYIQTRSLFSSIAKNAFSLFNAVYQTELQLNQAKALAENPDNKAVDEGITAAQHDVMLRSLRPYMPSLAVAMGYASFQPMKSSIPLMKYKTRWNSDRGIQVAFMNNVDNNGKPIAIEKGRYDLDSGQVVFNKAGRTTNLSSSLEERFLADLGVGALASFIQSHDAYIAFKVMEAVKSQNYHDANTANAYELEAMAKIQNEAFLDAISTSHIGVSFINAFLKPLKAYAEGQVSHTPEAVKALNSTFYAMAKKLGLDPDTTPKAQVLEYMVDVVTANDVAKLNNLLNMHAINQYGTEGGEYLLDDSKRKELIKRGSDLKKSIAKIKKEAEVISGGLEAYTGSKGYKRQLTLADIKAAERENDLVAESKPEHDYSPMEKELINNREHLSQGKNLITFLMKNLDQHIKGTGTPGKFAAVYKELLHLAKGATDGLQINIMTHNEVDPSVLGYKEAMEKGLHAWFKAENGKRQINVIIGTDRGRIDTRVLVHEMLHAATAEAILIVKAEPKKYAKANESLERIEQLLEHVRTKVSHGSSELTKYGVTNVDEFIATGLTYSGFIAFLDDITVLPEPKTQRRMPSITSVFGSMVSNVLDIYYSVFGKGRDPDPTKRSAFEALVIDVAQFVDRTSNIKSGVTTAVNPAPSQQAAEEVNQYTAREVYDSLPPIEDVKFNGHLQQVMTRVTDNLFTALDRKYVKASGGYSPEQVWNKALESGKAPYITEAIASGFKLSDREQFAVEALEIALGEAVKDNRLSSGYAEIGKTYDDAKAKLKPEDFMADDWATASAEQKALAQAKYDFLFDGKKADHLTRFTAMALGSQELNLLLNFNAERRAKKAGSELSPFERMVQVADNAIDFATDKLNGLTGFERVNDRLPILASNLVDLSLKNRNKSMNQLEQAMEKIDLTLNGMVNKAMDLGYQAADAIEVETRTGQNMKNLAKATLGGQPMEVFNVFAEMRNLDNPNTTLGFMGELNKEIGSVSKDQGHVERLLAVQKHHETQAQRIRSVVSKDLLSMFSDDGAKLNQRTREAVTYMVMRTDLQSLSANHDMNSLGKLLTEKAYRAKEIARLEKQVAAPVFIARAKILGWYMVSGTGNKFLVKNAYGIATNAGLMTNSIGIANEKDVQAIDQLASLYAIEYSRKEDKQIIKGLLDSEAEGLEALIKYHKGLVHDSASAFFGDNRINMTKGYLPEVTNPHRDVVVAKSKMEADNLRAAMYKEVRTLGKDNSDPSDFEPVLFYSEDAGKQRIISGAMALYNYGRKGTSLDLDTQELVGMINDARNSLVTTPDFDPRTDVEGNFAIPHYATDGSITGFGYEMSHETRDNLLQRNNDFSEMVGTFSSLGYTKVSNKAQNANMVRELKKMYDSSKHIDQNKFVYVSYESTDPVAYAAWDRLPKDAKEEVKKVWGTYGMWVPNDVFLSIFGAPKLSLFTASFDKHESLRGVFEELYVTAMKGMFGDNARVAAAKTERMWQEAVALSKNFIVIRNASTLLMNLASNTFLLMAHGVPVTDLIKNTRDSMKGGIQYRKDIAMLTKLQARQRAGIGDAADVQDQIDRLSHRIEQNPMYDFIQQGMFAGIVEDIDPNQDMYSYQSGLQKKVDGVYKMIPKPLRTVAEYAFVTPSTPIYQFLHSATQYSDFSAKYVLYKHYTETASKKLTKDEAIQEASNNFINYDVPTSPGLQYANDMGILMFTKYNLRIQKALFKLLAERPASALGQAATMNYLGSSLPPGIDPLVFNQMGMPFRDGAFGLLDTWNESFPLQIFN